MHILFDSSLLVVVLVLLCNDYSILFSISSIASMTPRVTSFAGIANSYPNTCAVRTMLTAANLGCVYLVNTPD